MAPGKLSEEEWRRRLTPERFGVLRLKGTEPPFRNEHWDEKRDGAYECAGCRGLLFLSEAKYDSGTGWPSFFASVPDAVREEPSPDGRTEALCARCGGHLGHVFDDGPPPSGRRYCMNSASLVFVPRDGATDD